MYARPLVVAFAVFAACATPAPPPPAADTAVITGELVRLESPHDYRTTIDRTVRAMENKNFRILTVMDQASLPVLDESGASPAPEERPEPTSLVVFGRPELHAPLVKAGRTLGLDLPFKALVLLDGEKVSITWVPPSRLAARHGVDPAGHGLPALDKEIHDVFDWVIATDPIPSPGDAPMDVAGPEDLPPGIANPDPTPPTP
jgi:uncharacterized protein (DUF302 family)